MTDVMKGIRVLEVAEHTFVPSASAVLADWGADVIKIEHAVRGDAMRASANLASGGTRKVERRCSRFRSHGEVLRAAQRQITRPGRPRERRARAQA